MYFEQPQGLISVATGPIAGALTGGPAAIIQIYYEDKLHLKQPDRFPPGPLQFLHNYFAKHEHDDDDAGADAAERGAAPAAASQRVLTESKQQTLAAKFKPKRSAEDGASEPQPAAASGAVEVSVEKV